MRAASCDSRNVRGADRGASCTRARAARPDIVTRLMGNGKREIGERTVPAHARPITRRPIEIDVTLMRHHSRSLHHDRRRIPLGNPLRHSPLFLLYVAFLFSRKTCTRPLQRCSSNQAPMHLRLLVAFTLQSFKRTPQVPVPAFPPLGQPTHAQGSQLLIRKSLPTLA